jgi:iron uptake system component EfeO
MRRAASLAAGLAALAALAGCGGSNGNSNAQTLKITLTAAGCSPARATAKSGPVTFEVVNGGTSKVSELELLNRAGIILGERENVVDGIEGSFTLNLGPGTYTLSCPNGSSKPGSLVVTGTATAAHATAGGPLLADATLGYRRFVQRQADELLASTRQFAAALKAGNLAGAKALFGPTRYHYETIEPVAESFGNLDPEIDARANDVPASQWTGFHRIEKILWEDGTTEGTAGYATKLVADVTRLDRLIGTLHFQAPQLANGAVELLNEVANSKITGEEDRYSHTDLSDFAANVEGAREAFLLLRPALDDLGDRSLAATIAARFATVTNGLDRYKRPTALGYATYSELTPADRRAFAQEVDALAEPLSTVAARVSG